MSQSYSNEESWPQAYCEAYKCPASSFSVHKQWSHGFFLPTGTWKWQKTGETSSGNTSDMVRGTFNGTSGPSDLICKVTSLISRCSQQSESCKAQVFLLSATDGALTAQRIQLNTPTFPDSLAARSGWWKTAHPPSFLHSCLIYRLCCDRNHQAGRWCQQQWHYARIQKWRQLSSWSHLH